MATALFISLSELKKNTAISGNIDANKLLPAIKTAQQLEIEPILGTDLYNKISNDIISSGLTGNYLTLKQNYIHDILIHYAVYYYLPYATFIISNGGVSKWDGGDNYSALETSDLTVLMNKEKALAESYKKRLINHLCNYSSLYPEYVTNSNDDIYPTKSTNRTGLFLD